MGREVACRARFGGATCEGRALLESDHVLFRGRFRVKIPFADASPAIVGDALHIDSPQGRLTLEVGTKEAAKWLEAMKHPKTRIQKLGVKPGARISIIGVRDDAFAAELKAAGADVSTRARKGSDLIFFQGDAPSSLARIAGLVTSLRSDGGLWVITPRGVAGLKDTDVMAAAKEAGLVDVKVVRFSETHSANKFVIPLSKR